VGHENKPVHVRFPVASRKRIVVTEKEQIVSFWSL
jgi:hypothetical protein